MRYFVFIFLHFILLESAFSQNNPLKFKRLSTADGLSNSWVRCVYKDDIGFMWFGTRDGLNRYDGNEFKVYRPKTRNGKTLGDIMVSDILRKDANELWICTHLGVYIYNYLDDEIHPFSLVSSVVTLCIIEDEEKRVWFGTNNGLYRLDTDTKEITHFLHQHEDLSSISSNNVNAILQDAESNLWIGTRGGLNLYDRRSNSFLKFTPKDIAVGISTNDVMSICEDHNKRIWIGYAQDGLFACTGNPGQKVEFNKVIDGEIIKLLVDHRNTLWIGQFSGEGLDRIDLNEYSLNKKPKIEHFFSDPQDINSLSGNSIYSIYEDNLNDIWIGTFGNGISYYSKRIKKFNVVNAGLNDNKSIKNNLVNALVEDENHLYVGTESGLDVLNKKNGTFTHYQNETNDPNSLGGNPVYTLYKDSRGNLWIGTWTGGLNLFNPQAKTFKRFLPNGKGSISNANVFSISEDKSGNLWVGTIDGGLNRYDYNTGSFSSYKNDVNNPGSLSSNMVNCIYQTSTGRLYISTYNSLDLYDYQKDNFIHFKHDFNDSSGNFGDINLVFEDSRRNIWVATNAGLELFNEKTSTFSTYTIENGLPDNCIQAILEDDHGNLWISTNNGISKFINGINLPNPPVFFNYTHNDGLSGNEFKRKSAFKNEQGIMYFGSSQGYTYFHPDSIKINPLPPEVILSSFLILNSQPDNKYKEITKNINFIEAVDLTYRNSDFIIRFAALNYLNPQNNLFKYKLEGYDADWNEDGNQQSATYTNLNPGEYVFMVMASNNDGIWCKSPKTIRIIVHPPWWKTLLFKMGLIIIIILLLVALYRIRISMLKNQKRILEKTVHERTNQLEEMNFLLEQKQEEISIQNEELSKHKDQLEFLVKQRTAELIAAKEKAEESDNLKSTFLANMSHEVRTPLNAILGFSTLLEESNLTLEERADFIEIIHRSGDRLMQLINDIIDISKIESKQLSINLQEHYLYLIIRNSLQTFERSELLHNKPDITLMLNYPDAYKDLVIFTDEFRLQQVLDNLVANAIKYTEKGFVEVGIELKGSPTDEMIEVYVKDTGLGIPKEKHALIFERFRQVEEFSYHEGTGLGLSISKGIIQLLKGEIWFTSEKNKGTTFYFTIPYDKQKKMLKKPENRDIEPIDLNNKTIIIAEDDYSSFAYLKELLKGFKAKIIHAENGQVLMDKLETYLPDLILLDINMPVKSGMECLKEIRSKNLTVKIIAQTAYAMNVEKEKYLAAGCNAYVSKPIKKHDLYEVISLVMADE